MNTKNSLFVIFLTTMLDWVGIGLVYPLFSSLIFQTDISILGHSTSEAARGLIFGCIIAFTSVLEFIFAPILGVLSDNHGRKKVMVASLACAVLGYILSYLAIVNESIALFFLSRMVIGISSSSAGVYSAAIADLSSCEEKAKRFGIYSMMCGVGFAIGPVLGGVISRLPDGYSYLFLGAALCSLCNMLLVSAYFLETHERKEKVCLTESYSFFNFNKLFAYREFRSLFIALFLGGIGWSLYWEFMPVSRITQSSYTIQDLGALYTYEAIFYGLSCGLLIRWVVNRFGGERCFFFAMTSLALFVGVLCIDKNPAMLWVYIPIQQFMLAIFNTTATTLVSNGAHHSIQGEVLGVQTSVQSFAFAIAPMLGGLMISVMIELPLIVGATCLLIGAAVVACAIPKKIFSRGIRMTHALESMVE